MRLFITLCLVGLVSLFALSCSGSMHSFEAYEELNPIEDLPEPTEEHNLVVRINNVADTGTSHENKAILFINGKKVDKPKDEIGYRRDYTYHFILKQGVYEVKAVYYAKGKRKYKKYKFSTPDGKFRIFPGQRTLLSIDLDKRLDGKLKSKNNFFEETTTDMDGITAIPDKAERNAPARERDKAQSNIKIKITSIPSGAHVYVDGHQFGKTPLTTSLIKTSGHSVQVSKRGYKSKILYIDEKEMRGKTSHSLKAKLKKS